jgi:hypothetical protein
MIDNADLNRWFELDIEQLSDHPNGAKQLQTGAADGFLVRGVLSENEAQAIVDGLSKFERGLQFPMPFGHIIGEPLMIAPPDMASYFENASVFRRELQQQCGLDFDDRLSKIFAQMSGQRGVACPNTADGQLYGASVIRILAPGTDGLHVHAGNEFINEYESMKDLGNNTVLYDQLSYFVVLQAPEQGGELCLYDLEWDSTPEVVHTERYPHFSLERDSYFKNIERRSLNPQVGDLIFFAGGRIWHQVCPVYGQVDRITMGGFTSFSRDDDMLYFWS